jgi:hypothetical protein
VGEFATLSVRFQEHTLDIKDMLDHLDVMRRRIKAQYCAANPTWGRHAARFLSKSEGLYGAAASDIQIKDLTIEVTVEKRDAFITFVRDITSQAPRNRRFSLDPVPMRVQCRKGEPRRTARPGHLRNQSRV